MIKATGHRVLVEVEQHEEKTKGGIILPDQVRDAERRAAEIGKVIDIGPTAWQAAGLGNTPWCQVGDRIFFAKYAGKWVQETDDSPEYLIINDDDVMGVII